MKKRGLIYIIILFLMSPVISFAIDYPISDEFSSKNIGFLMEGVPKVDIGIVNNFEKVEIPDEFYSKWIQPGLPYPWELKVEERLKLQPKEVVRRHFEGLNRLTAYQDWYGTLAFLMIDAAGNTRRRVGRQWQTGKLRSLPKEKNPEGLLGKNLFIMHEPEDIRGFALMTWTHISDDKLDDIWMFFPGLRKVRRMSESSKQDSMMGTDYSQEDFAMRVGNHTYKKTGEEIFKGPPKGTFGLGYDECLKRYVNGVGRKCQIIEQIPKRPWYYSKTVYWMDPVNYIMYYNEKYDKKGRLFQTHNDTSMWAHGLGKHSYGHKDWYLIYDYFPTHNLMTNHKTITQMYTWIFDQNLPDRVWSSSSWISSFL